MAKEHACVAGGTEVAYINIFGEKAGRGELRTIGFAEIQVDILGGRLVAGRLHVEPLEWVRLFAGAGLVEIVSRIGKLRCEFGSEVGGNFVAARANRRADGGQ